MKASSTSSIACPAAPGAIAHVELDAWLGAAYARAFAREPLRDVLSALCHTVATRLGLTLVMLSRATPSGLCEAQAQSVESALWAALQHVPERCDDSFAGHGACGRALRSGAPLLLGAGDPSLLAWREALERERVVNVLAWPLKAAGSDHVLEMFSASPLPPGTVSRDDLQMLARGIGQLIDNLQELRQDRLLADALNAAGNAAFITDLEGNIVWSNAALSQLSGHAPGDLVGRNPRVLKSGQQSLRYYRELWNTLRRGEVWRGETVDSDRSGRAYVVQQTISPVIDQGRITHYLSVQTDITREKEQARQVELDTGTDAVSGLPTLAAFEAAATQALAVRSEQDLALVLISARYGNLDFERLAPAAVARLQAECGRTLRGLVAPPDLACSPAPGEWLLLLHDAADPDLLVQRALEALAHVPAFDGRIDMPALRSEVACTPADGLTLTALRHVVERRLSHEPAVRARRRARLHAAPAKPD